MEPLPHSALRCASRGAPKSRPRPHGTPLRAHPLARPPADKNRARAASPRATGRTEGPFFAQELRFFGLRGPLRPGAAALRALLPPPSSVAPWEWTPERPLGGLAMEPFGARLCSGLPQEPSLPKPWGPALWRCSSPPPPPPPPPSQLCSSLGMGSREAPGGLSYGAIWSPAM